MYNNYVKNFQIIQMENASNNESNKNIHIINQDEEHNKTTVLRKQKGWGHWSSYIKSTEYTDLIPGKAHITEEELSRHNKPGDLWIALSHEGRVVVYDVTAFADYHPGGYEIIEAVAGKDATEDFRLAHAYVSPNMISKFQKGFLVKSRFKSPNSLLPARTILPPVRLPSSKNKPRWDWSESNQIINFKINLHKVLLQKLNSVTVQCRDSKIFKMRIFFETEYYYFEIQLNDHLTVILDSLYYDDCENYISLQMKNSEKFQLSHLGGIVEDYMVSVNDAVDKEEYFPCTLVRTRDLNFNCREFIFQWPSWIRVGIPIGHHVIVRSNIEGEEVQRPYTPVCQVTPNSTESVILNQITVMVKRYSDGKMSSYLHTLDEDAKVLLSLPLGSLKTPSWINGHETIPKSPGIVNVDSVVFVAAGSGITPMIRLMLSCLLSPNIQSHLVFFNRNRCDITYADDLAALQRFYPDRLKINQVLSQPDADWDGFKGRISEESFKHLLVSDYDSKSYFFCGPTGFNKTVLKILKSWNIPDEHIWEFKG